MEREYKQKVNNRNYLEKQKIEIKTWESQTLVELNVAENVVMKNDFSDILTLVSSHLKKGVGIIRKVFFLMIIKPF